MRGIKIRAWDKENKKMYHDWGFDSGLGKCFWLRCFSHVTEQQGKEQGYDLPDKAEWHKNIVFLQYTGLKDKDGVEIYEGDIVHVVEDNCMGGTYLGAIKYLNNWGIYGFNMLDAKVIEVRDFGKNTMGFLMKQFGNCFTLVEANKHGRESQFLVEVIGNIYENPGLLEESK